MLKTHSVPTSSPYGIFFISLMVLLVACGGAFVGGYYLGKSQRSTNTKHDWKPLTQTLTYERKAYSVNYSGEVRVVPAFRGSFPVEDFVQPRAALVDRQLVTASGNPLLTPKGTSQIFIYQYKEEVSFIVTVTGQNYGEKLSISSNASLVGEGQYTLTSTGVEGDFIQMTDGYSQVHDRIPIPGNLSVKLEWGNVGSRGFIFTLRDPDSLNATFDFKSLSGAMHPLNIRGSHGYDIEISKLPSPDNPLRVSPYNGEVSVHNTLATQSGMQVAVNSSKSNSTLEIFRLVSNYCKRRSISSRVSPGIGFILRDPDTGEVRHRLEIRRDNRHGGKFGTMCWNIQNHEINVEVSFCVLYHEAYYDGVTGTPYQEGVNSVLLNAHFRDMKENSDSAGKWQHITMQIHSANPNTVINNLEGNRESRSSGISCCNKLSKESRYLLSDGGDLVERAWDQASDGAVAAYDALINEFNSMKNQTIQWYCDMAEGLIEGVGCLQGLKQFIQDIKAMSFKDGLVGGTQPTICDGIFAGKSCATFTNDCF
jgi:hypothetical protein